MAERPKTGSGKKFSITIQVPDDVAAEWPQRSTAEKLIHEVYAAMGGTPPASSPAPRASRRPIVLLLAAIFGVSAIGGYLGAKGYDLLLPSARPPVSTPPRAERQVPVSQPVASAPQPKTGPASPPATTPNAPATTPNAPATTPQAPAATPSAPAQPPAPAMSYRVQVGAFKVRENAEILAQRLQSDGFTPEIVSSAGLRLVLVGRFATREDAERLAAQLKTLNYDVAVVQQASPK